MLCKPCQSTGTCAWESAGSLKPRLCPVPPDKRNETPTHKIDLTGLTSQDSVHADETLLITTHFNPCGWERLRQTYYEWLPTLGPLARRLVCYELVLDNDLPEIEDSVVIRGTRELNWLWQKEALINRALKDMPHGMKNVAWLDHDFVIRDTQWLDHAVAMLQADVVAVQLFENVVYLDMGHHVVGQMIGRVSSMHKTGKPWGNPGGIWLASADYLRSVGGLYAHNIHGGGDEVWFDGMTGTAGAQMPEYTETMREHVTHWISHAVACRDGRRAGYLPSVSYHLWHGDLHNRQYKSRYAIVKDHDYDPQTDVCVTEEGLLQWSSDKPALHTTLSTYFRDRREDGVAATYEINENLPTFVTSISPHPSRQDDQRRAIESWLQLGARVVAMQSEADQQYVSDHFPHIEVRVTKDTVDQLRPTLNAMLSVAVHDSVNILLINSDIEIHDSEYKFERLWGHVPANVLQMAIRHDYTNNVNKATRDLYGMDAFLVTPDMAVAFPSIPFLAMGLTHWDYVLPYVLSELGYTVAVCPTTGFLHKQHTHRWKWSDLEAMQIKVQEVTGLTKDEMDAWVRKITNRETNGRHAFE